MLSLNLANMSEPHGQDFDLVFAGKDSSVIICYMLRQLIGSVAAARADCVVQLISCSA